MVSTAWLASAVDGNYDNPNNWSAGVVPSDTAFFGYSNITSISIPINFSIGSLVFNQSQTYNISITTGGVHSLEKEL
jgi:hypothetical protein